MLHWGGKSNGDVRTLLLADFKPFNEVTGPSVKRINCLKVLLCKIYHTGTPTKIHYTTSFCYHATKYWLFLCNAVIKASERNREN